MLGMIILCALMAGAGIALLFLNVTELTVGVFLILLDSPWDTNTYNFFISSKDHGCVVEVRPTAAVAAWCCVCLQTLCFWSSTLACDYWEKRRKRFRICDMFSSLKTIRSDDGHASSFFFVSTEKVLKMLEKFGWSVFGVWETCFSVTSTKSCQSILPGPAKLCLQCRTMISSSCSLSFPSHHHILPRDASMLRVVASPKLLKHLTRSTMEIVTRTKTVVTNLLFGQVWRLLLNAEVCYL